VGGVATVASVDSDGARTGSVKVKPKFKSDKLYVHRFEVVVVPPIILTCHVITASWPLISNKSLANSRVMRRMEQNKALQLQREAALASGKTELSHDTMISMLAANKPGTGTGAGASGSSVTSSSASASVVMTGPARAAAAAIPRKPVRAGL